MDWYKNFNIRVVKSNCTWESFDNGVKITPDEYAFKFSDSEFECINKLNGIVNLLTHIEKCIVAGYSKSKLFNDIFFDGYMKSISLVRLKSQLAKVFPVKRLNNEIKDLSTKNKNKKLIFVKRIPWELTLSRFSLYSRFGFGIA